MIDPNQPDYALTPVHPTRKRLSPRLLVSNDSPVLSIITPFYNTGTEFDETASSILEQSLQQWEWLIINDGSTDQTALSILAEFRHRDARIHVIDHPENRGLSAARNTGISHARCEYILFLDSDDLLEPSAAEKWWWYLETHPHSGFVASYHVAFGGSNFLWTGGFQDGAMNAQRNRVSMMCMVRKAVFDVVGMFDESIRGGLEDWEFWMRCAANGWWGGNIPEYLAWYRVREDHSDRWENLQEARLDEFRTILQNSYPHLYHGGFPVVIDTVDYDLTTINLEIPFYNQLVKTSPHLLIILPWLVMGGAERFALNLMDQLILRGWAITIVTTAQSDNPWLHEFEKRTPDVFILPDFLPIKDYPRFIAYLIKSRGFDAVMVQGSQEGYRLTPVIKSYAPQIPILDFLHFVTPDWMQGGFPRLSQLYNECIDFTFVSCKQVREWMLGEGSLPEQVEVCYIGVDPQLWKPDPALRQQERSNLSIGQEDLVLLYAARLEEQKQPGIFLETLRRLSERGDSFHALVAGEGSLFGYLKTQLRQAGLQECVHLLGRVPSEKMPAIMAASDIFFLPSQNEGISQAVYEAMACGLVVVSSNVGGQAEVVSPDCGVLVSPEVDSNATGIYADTLHDLMHDAPRRQRMSQASRERILESFTLQQMGDCVQTNLRRIIDIKKNLPEVNHTATDKKAIEREARAVVEYLQARQELRKISQQLSTAVIPRKPSHWFYLWVRQLLLPLSERVKTNFLGEIMLRLQKSLKRALIK